MSAARVPLGEAHRDATTARILEAARDVVADEGVARFSVPEVSRRSGVSLATIYRHFSSKEALLDAAASVRFELGSTLDATPRSVDGLIGVLQHQWARFDDQRSIVRVQHGSEAGVEVRRQRMPMVSAFIADALRNEGVDPTSPEGRRLLSLCLLLGGSAAFLELVDRQQLSRAEAVEVAEWAVRALVAVTAAETRNTSADRRPPAKSRRPSRPATPRSPR